MGRVQVLGGESSSGLKKLTPNLTCAIPNLNSIKLKCWNIVKVDWKDFMSLLNKY